MPITIKDGNLTATCDDCGKELTVPTAVGIFCEDMCGHKESVKAGKQLDKFIDEMFKHPSERK